MSKNDRHLPYHVAFRQITGRDPSESTHEDMSIVDVLDRCRQGHRHILRFHGLGGYGHVIGDGHQEPWTSITVKGDGLRHVGIVDLYPVGGALYKDGQIQPGKDDSFPVMLFTVDDHDRELMTYLMDEDDRQGKTSMYLTQKVQQMHLQPFSFTHSDEILFATVKSGIKAFMVTGPDDRLSFIDRVYFRVMFYVSPENVRVTTTVSDPGQFRYLSDRNMSGDDYHSLMKMTSGKYRGQSKLNAVTRDISVSSRRRADHDDLGELVKMINGGMPADEVDLEDHDLRVKYQLYHW